MPEINQFLIILQIIHWSEFQNFSKMVDKADDLVYVNEISPRFNESVHNDYESKRLTTNYGKKAFMRFVNFFNRFLEFRLYILEFCAVQDDWQS